MSAHPQHNRPRRTRRGPGALIITLLASLTLNCYLLFSRPQSQPPLSLPITSQNLRAMQSKGITQTLPTTAPTRHTAIPKRVHRESSQDNSTTPHESSSAPLSPQKQFSIDTRMSVLNRFFDLDDEEKTSLREKFTSEALDSDAPTPSLAAILGADRAKFYNDQRKEARKRFKEEERERKVYYLSRRLGLSPSQEKAFFELERQIDLDSSSPPNSLSNQNPRQYMRALIEGLQSEQELREQGLQSILTRDQWETYQLEQARSSLQELELWHGEP